MTIQLRPITDVAADLGFSSEQYEPVGRFKAKINLDAKGNREGQLVLVSAISPTKAGEGKTTVSVGLADGLKRVGSSVALCLREPSLGPVFGIKGGGTGGGKAQLEPANEINLHFTGDLHAIAAAHNLLAALIDTDLHFGGASGLTPERVTWSRALDVNDRALRNIRVGIGGPAERDSRFDITAASEIMAILALSESLEDLRGRIGRIVVGTRANGTYVTAADLGAVDALVALLTDAIKPNLAQTREGTAAFVHCGPFGNIAHGCSSVVATQLALTRADVVVTEAGFGFDLGGEKFLDIKMRQTGRWPSLVVLVTTVRALASHGGEGSLTRGLEHLERQLANTRRFNLNAVVALNVFPTDTPEELRQIEAFCAEREVPIARFTAFVDGGAGAEALARTVLAELEKRKATAPEPRYAYELEDSILTKLEKVAKDIYGAGKVETTESAAAQIAELEAAGYGKLPICVAKTHLSFSGDAKDGGLAKGFTLTVQEARLSAGAGFIVLLLGAIVTMPALPRDPAAKHVRVDSSGNIRGLMQGE